MNNLDAEIKIPLKIRNLNSEKTIVQVDIPYSDDWVQIEVPNNIQEGYRVKLDGKGYTNGAGDYGDLYVVISEIIYPDSCESASLVSQKMSIQKMVVVKENDFSEVNNYLEDGWNVKEFKPYGNNVNLYVYVLLEK